MKLTIFLVLFLTVFVAYTQGQCFQAPRQQNCVSPRHLGQSGRNCHRRTMWYYDAGDRNCKEMPFRGCGGNPNRYCSKADCEQKCRR